MIWQVTGPRQYENRRDSFLGIFAPNLNGNFECPRGTGSSLSPMVNFEKLKSTY